MLRTTTGLAAGLGVLATVAAAQTAPRLGTW